MVLNELKEGQTCLLDTNPPEKVRVVENVGKKVKVKVLSDPGVEIISDTYWQNGGVEVLKVY